MRTTRYHILLFVAATLVGVVAPFAFGSTPEVGIASSILSRRPTLSTLHSATAFQKQATPRSFTAHTAVAESVTEASKPSPTENSKRSRLRRVISKLRPGSGLRDGSWKKGETGATIPSQLFFSYVAPLLDLASNRTLTEDDAFAVATHRQMDTSVDVLATEYDKARGKAHKRIEELKASGTDKVKNSQSIILLKALINQQRGVLILTGILRLINTGIQAFPAILVSKLLRSIEGGDTLPISKSLSAALMLVSVLSLKMVTENQFFHRVVNMATTTRGSLEGLIFDKSLRLPDGGSGVLAKQRSGKEKKALGSGGVLNLLQTDTTIIESTVMQLHTLWDGPLQVSFIHCVDIVPCIRLSDRHLICFVSSLLSDFDVQLSTLQILGT